ncbi:hypothetical protein VJ918_07110 [Adlercreutzia sp. R21]|uniref:hypothetical protein n=1 Tax=Adlercreutzia wanghongyangiae TaxID=3111451 RepID=UPI002DB5B37B|nr:hypothetical protein [Adlercreutzia sp. R21]MEC4184577.1 hypothetical protein [Adlercreutzia sp. R21]
MIESDKRFLGYIISLVGGAEHTDGEAIDGLFVGGDGLCYVQRSANRFQPLPLGDVKHNGRTGLLAKTFQKFFGGSCKKEGLCGV